MGALIIFLSFPPPPLHYILFHFFFLSLSHLLNHLHFNRWDEWVPESRTLKYNEENLKRQAELIESVSSKKKASNKAGASKSGGGSSSSGGGSSGVGGDGGADLDKSSGDKMKKRPRESVEKVSACPRIKGLFMMRNNMHGKEYHM